MDLAVIREFVLARWSMYRVDEVITYSLLDYTLKVERLHLSIYSPLFLTTKPPNYSSEFSGTLSDDQNKVLTAESARLTNLTRELASSSIEWRWLKRITLTRTQSNFLLILITLYQRAEAWNKWPEPPRWDKRLERRILLSQQEFVGLLLACSNSKNFPT